MISVLIFMYFFFQAEDGIRDLVRSRGLGDVYKRQVEIKAVSANYFDVMGMMMVRGDGFGGATRAAVGQLSLIHI